MINGRNIWRNNYAVSLGLVDALKQVTANVAVSTASSLLHVPFSTEGEDGLADDVRKHFAFAVQKLDELHEVAVLADASDDEKKASAGTRSQPGAVRRHPRRRRSCGRQDGSQALPTPTSYVSRHAPNARRSSVRR